MSAETTQYDVALRYVYKDAGAQGRVRGLAQELRGAGAATTSLRSGLLGIGTTLATGLAGVAAKRAFIDFNDNMEQARIQMAGLMMQAGAGGDWTQNFTKANVLVEDFQQIAKQSIGTTKDFVDMASMIVRPITAAGLGMRDLEEFTRGAVIASRAFGIAADVAARDIEGALMGQLRSVDRFARSLLEPLGYTGEEGRQRFNALSQAERAAELQKALTSDAIKEMAKAQEHSFAGVTSTLKDNLQMTMGKIGLPLFQEITKEVQKWNDWISANPEKIRQFAADFTGALMEGFRLFKEIAGWIVQHKDLLLTLAKAYLASKAVGFVAGGVQGVAQTLASLAAGPGSLAAFGMSIAGVTAALGAFAAAAVIVADQLDKRQDRQIAAKTDFGVLDRGMSEFMQGKFGGRYAAGSREARVAAEQGQGAADWMLAQRMITQARDAGMLLRNKEGRDFVNAAAVSVRGVEAGKSSQEIQAYISALNTALREERIYLTNLSPEQRRAQFGEQMASIEEAFRVGGELWSKMTIRAWNSEFDAGWQNKVGRIFQNVMDIPAYLAQRGAEATKSAATSTAKKPTSINVNITHLEVAAPDTDRFIFDMANLARRELKSPSGAYDSLVEG
jgi:hypothetical protein